MRWTYPEARPGERIYAIAIARPQGLRGLHWNARPVSHRYFFVSNPTQTILNTFPPHLQVTLGAGGFVAHALIDAGYVEDLNRGVWVKPHEGEPRARYPAPMTHNNQQTRGRDGY